MAKSRKGHLLIWCGIVALAAVIFFEWERQVAIELAVAKLQTRMDVANAASHAIDVKVSGLNAQISDIQATVNNLTVQSAHMSPAPSAPTVNIRPKSIQAPNIFESIKAWLDSPVKPIIPPEFVIP